MRLWWAGSWTAALSVPWQQRRLHSPLRKREVIILLYQATSRLLSPVLGPKYTGEKKSTNWSKFSGGHHGSWGWSSCPARTVWGLFGLGMRHLQEYLAAAPQYLRGSPWEGGVRLFVMVGRQQTTGTSWNKTSSHWILGENFPQKHKQWHSEVVQSPSLELFKAWLDKAPNTYLSSWLSLLWEGGRTRDVLRSLLTQIMLWS